MILPARQRSEALHGAFDDAGHLRVVRVHRLARLEEGVRVLRGAADERMFGVQRAPAMGADQIIIDHRPDVGVAQQIQRVQLVRRAEAVEEMQERDPRLQRGHLRKQGGVMRVLHARKSRTARTPWGAPS